MVKRLAIRGIFDEHKVRILLWIAICGLLHTQKGSRVSTRFVRPLVDLSLVHSYDWDELGYCILLSYMRTTCRQLSDDASVSVYGSWGLLEV